MLSLVVQKVDPRTEKARQEVYEILERKNYQWVTPYLGSKQRMTVICPAGHQWSAFPPKLKIPCNNCQECLKIRGLSPADRIGEIITARNATQLTPYVLNKLKIQIRCAENHEFPITPGDVTSGKWCNICAGNNVEVAKAKFYGIVQEKGGRALTEYTNSISRVYIVCHRNHLFSPIASSINMGTWCCYCNGNSRLQGEAKLRMIVAERGGIILTPYQNRYTPIWIQCDQGHIVEKWPCSITSGGWCSKCSNKCPIQAEFRFRTTVANMNGTVIGQYLNNKLPVTIQCQWGHPFDMTPGHISGGQWCPRCRGHCPIQAQERFRDVVQTRNGAVIGEYINTFTKVDVCCEKGHRFGIKPNNATNGKWCRPCGLGESKGERAVREFLTRTNIEFEPEKRFAWMGLKKYDFLFTYQGRQYLVEFDGIQHFKFIPFFHDTPDVFAARQQIDIDKTVNALNQGYFFIRIAHTDLSSVDLILDGIINDPNPIHRLAYSDPPMYQWLNDGLQNRLNPIPNQP